MTTAAVQSHQVVGVSFTPEQLELRRRTLGASEVPAVLGLDRYKSPHDIWLTKRGLVPPFAGNEHTEWGLRIEPVIRANAAEVLGVTMEQPGTLIHEAHPWASATPDGMFTLEGEPHVLEIKNKTDRQAVHWGVAGTDEVPNDIAAQVYWQMLVTGTSRGVVAVLFGKSDFRLYHLTRDAEIAGSIFDACRAFWARHIEEGIEPEISGGSATRDYLKSKFSAHGDAVRDATRDEATLIGRLREVRDRIKALEADKEAIENKLLAAIGSDAGIKCSAGRVTWKAPAGMQVGWKDVALAMKAPQSVIDQFSTPMSRRFTATFPKEG
jgi:putative phage-type endonuclease